MSEEAPIISGDFDANQVRPIITLHHTDQGIDAWNDSLTTDFLWTSANIGEAVPDVMTPCSWSLLQLLMADMMPTLFIVQRR